MSVFPTILVNGKRRPMTEGEYDAWQAQVAAKEAEPALIPQTVSARQARVAMSRSGLLAEVEASLANMTGQEGEEARIEWEYATDIRRDHPLVTALAADLGLTSEDMDNLFIQAAGI